MVVGSPEPWSIHACSDRAGGTPYTPAFPRSRRNAGISDDLLLAKTAGGRDLGHHRPATSSAGVACSRSRRGSHSQRQTVRARPFRAVRTTAGRSTCPRLRSLRLRTYVFVRSRARLPPASLLVFLYWDGDHSDIPTRLEAAGIWPIGAQRRCGAPRLRPRPGRLSGASALPWPEDRRAQAARRRVTTPRTFACARAPRAL
jgi:hypothetical protein